MRSPSTAPPCGGPLIEAGEPVLRPSQKRTAPRRKATDLQVDQR